MVTLANNKDLTCSICGKIYTNPVLLSPCSHSFDRECILRYTHCPVERCNAPVFAHTLLPNNTLRNLLDHQNQLSNCTYELFLLDTSTSMWYSDFFFGLIGTSRFQMALKFLTEVFEQRWNSTMNRISLVTFDTNPIERFPFETARQQHQQALQKLRPNGAHTALFDAIKFCVEKFERVNQITNRPTAQCLYILTDGGDDFSSSGNQQHYIDYVKRKSGELSIIGHVIQVGDSNLPTTKRLCDEINFRFHHFNGGNAPEFASSFISSTNYDSDSLRQGVNALPDACTNPIRPISTEPKIGALA